MLFSNFVATIRADLDAIRDDLGEFVSTVKTDTTVMLGLGEDGEQQANATGSSTNAKHLQWEEELWENPELLCEDPTGDGDEWTKFVESSPVREEEVEMLLSGGVSEIVPELYRELVPSRTTHADFFKRLIYHRNRLNQVVRTRMQELVMDEEETRWEDDSVGDDATPTEPVASTAQINIAKERAASDAETAQLRSEVEQYKQEMGKLAARIAQLEKALEVSEAKRTDLEIKLAERAELPHKKPTIEVAKEMQMEKAPEALVSSSAHDVSATPPSTSWEALPTSPGSSSNEEPVVLSKHEEDEEDDWE